MALFLPRRWRRQPQYPVAVDWNNPIANGLIYDMLGSVPHYDACTESWTLPLGSAAEITQSVSSEGTAISLSGASAWYAVAMPKKYSFSDSQPWSFVWHGYAETSPHEMIAGEYATGDSWIREDHGGSRILITSAAGGSIGLISSALPSYAAQYAVCANGGGTGAGTVSLYIDSEYKNQVTSKSSRMDFDCIGNAYSDFGYSYDGSVRYARLYSRCLSLNEIMEMRANPWQIYRPQSARIYSFSTGAAPSSTVPPLYHQRQQQGLAS